ncbi:MAG: hypothetical protein IJF33_05615 [Clostridia bacterium]|nr:hypothetical protein [Clostridia bacterium]
MKERASRITKRIERLKALYRTLPVPSTPSDRASDTYRAYCTGDRWMTLGFLRGFAKHADAPTTRLRTSYAEAEELYQAKPQIYENELLLGHLYLPTYTEEEKREYDTLCEQFSMSAHTLAGRQPRKDHIGLDFEKLLRVGINGLRREIHEHLEALDFAAPDLYPNLDTVKQYEFYQCCLIELNAVSDLAKRYADEALRMAEQASEPRRSELQRLGRMLQKVPDEPAESFYEAVQSVQFFLSSLFGLYPLGRPDRYLYPYYERDLKNGSLTREFAQELIDNLCLCISDRVFSRAACGFIVGGKDASGILIENDLTYMFLTALDHLQLPDPNGALAVCKETSDELLSYAAEILSHGTTHPAFYNDDSIVDSLIKNYGVDPADAVNYIHSTCAEITVAGKSKGHTTLVQIDLPRLLMEVASSRSFESIDELFDAYLRHVQDNTKQRTLRCAIRLLEAARIGNEPMRICTLVDDCLARGKSIYEGGERYTFFQPIFVGFATAVDSLLAVSELVYEKQRLSLEEFCKICANNFDGEERLRQYILHKVAHYGNDAPVADAMAARLAGSLETMFEGVIPLWKQTMPGTFSYIFHATKGEAMGATFDGRPAHTSYSDGCGAVQGRDVSGPTAMIRSLTSWDQSRLLGGMVVNLKFGKNDLNERKRESLIALVRGFFARGGLETQINVVDRATLEDAKEHPEAHRDLLVRIGGYSDYFTRLSPVLQQEIIDRTEY